MKLKGIKFNTDGVGSDPSGDYGYTPEPKNPEPSSQADCPNGMVFVAGRSYVGCPPGWPSGLGCNPSEQFQPNMCVEPRSQEWCPAGTTFSPSYISGNPNSQMASVARIPAKCTSTTISPTPSNGATIQGDVKSAIQSLMDKNWLLPAIAIGVGVYLITKK